MPNCTTVVQTESYLFELEIRLNSPQNDTFRPFIRRKNLPKSFGIVQLSAKIRVYNHLIKIDLICDKTIRNRQIVTLTIRDPNLR